MVVRTRGALGALETGDTPLQGDRVSADPRFRPAANWRFESVVEVALARWYHIVVSAGRCRRSARSKELQHSRQTIVLHLEYLPSWGGLTRIGNTEQGGVGQI